MGRREQQLAHQIRSSVALWIEQNLEAPEGAMVTVTGVEVSSGRAHARVYISTLPDRTANETVALLNRDIRNIQHHVNRNVPARPVPRIAIVHDISPSEQERINRLITQAKK